MSIFLTIFSGTAVFVFGQLILKLLIEPINEFKKCISKIAYDLILYANVFANPTNLSNPKMSDSCQIMRQNSSTLHASLYLVPAYDCIYKLFSLPKKSDIIEATKCLIALSNGHDNVLENQGILNRYKMQQIKQNLGIIIQDGEWLDPKNEQKFIKAKENKH